MDVRLMGQHRGYYELALRALARAKVQKALRCPECGKQNKPGAMDIELDDHDIAWCPCGQCFSVCVDYDGHGV